MLDVTLRIILFITVAAVTFMILYGVYYLVETTNRPEHDAPAVVSELEFVPGHYIYVYNAALKTTLPQYVPDAWNVNVILDADHKPLDGMSCSEELFNSLRIGDYVTASYRVGRISSKKYLFGVRK